jgi:tRNA pseudouridine55 synthase
MRDDGNVHGWLVVDKPAGMTSNRVVEVVRRHFRAKAGHAGTLDPLATGVLPVAIGEATKTAGYAMAGPKRYRFRIRWGVARATDDSEGEITGECPVRPGREAIEAILPAFTGVIRQRPPVYSAIKINGRRAYELARRGKSPTPLERTVRVAELRLAAIADRDHADCEAVVGKGTYIRALVRDLGASLGTFAHVAELRRLSVGRFMESQAVTLDSITEGGHITTNCGFLLPVGTGLDDIPALILTEAEAARVRTGQRVTPSEPETMARLNRLDDGVVVGAWHGRALVALARVEHGRLRPVRVINC